MFVSASISQFPTTIIYHHSFLIIFPRSISTELPSIFAPIFLPTLNPEPITSTIRESSLIPRPVLIPTPALALTGPTLALIPLASASTPPPIPPQTPAWADPTLASAFTFGDKPLLLETPFWSSLLLLSVFLSIFTTATSAWALFWGKKVLSFPAETSTTPI